MHFVSLKEQIFPRPSPRAPWKKHPTLHEKREMCTHDVLCIREVLTGAGIGSLSEPDPQLGHHVRAEDGKWFLLHSGHAESHELPTVLRGTSNSAHKQVSRQN